MSCLGDVLEYSPGAAAFVTCDECGTPSVVQCNDEYRRTAGEACESAPSDLPWFRPDRLTRMTHAEHPCVRAIRYGEAVRGVELHTRHPDGRWHVLLASAKPVRDGGRITGAILVLQELTEQLREAPSVRAMFQHIAGAVPGVLYVHDLRTQRQIYSNGRAEQILGYSEHELNSLEGFLALLHPEDRASLDAHMQRLLAIKTGEVLEIEFRLRGKDGAWRWFHARDVLFQRGEDGHPGQILGLAQDITEQRDAETRLRESQDKYVRLFHSSNDGILLHGRFDDESRGRIIEANAKACELTGYSDDELRTLTPLAIVTDEDAENAPRDVERFNRSGSFVHRKTLVSRDGQRIPVEISSSIVDLGGKQMVLSIARDLRERVAAEQELRDREAQLRAIGDNLPSGAIYQFIIGAGNRLQFTYASAGFEHLFGVSPEDMLRGGRDLHEVSEPAFRNGLRQAETTARTSLSPFEQEFQTRHRTSGEVRWALARSKPRQVAGGVTVWDGVVFDITERKQMEEKLREEDRRKSEFLAILSHELRNPLATIRSGLYVLERSKPGSGESQRAQEILGRQANHLARLVDDLLDVTRISRGKIHLKVELMNLTELVRRTVGDHRTIFAKAKLSCELTSPPEPVPVNADPVRLTQVIGNVLQNSAKFTPPEGQVRVVVERRGEKAIVRVRDTGVGIPKESLDHVFEPFAQADRTLDRNRGGLGLGLALVKSLVELHGGLVQANSEGVGLGTEVTIALPLANGPSADDTERDTR